MSVYPFEADKFFDILKKYKGLYESKHPDYRKIQKKTKLCKKFLFEYYGENYDVNNDFIDKKKRILSIINSSKFKNKRHMDRSIPCDPLSSYLVPEYARKNSIRNTTKRKLKTNYFIKMRNENESSGAYDVNYLNEFTAIQTEEGYVDNNEDIQEENSLIAIGSPTPTTTRGDPNDTNLRNVEREVLIPKIMRDRAKVEHCSKEVSDFESCCKANNIAMVVTCRKQNSALRSCLEKWYKNETFKEECKQIYLQERADYRSSGIPKKHRVEKI